MELKTIAKLFKSLGDLKRLEILNLLKNGEECACNLLKDINLSQPALSHHMKILEEAQIVNSRKDGKWVYYSINPNRIKDIHKILDNFTEKID